MRSKPLPSIIGRTLPTPDTTKEMTLERADHDPDEGQSATVSTLSPDAEIPAQHRYPRSIAPGFDGFELDDESHLIRGYD